MQLCKGKWYTRIDNNGHEHVYKCESDGNAIFDHWEEIEPPVLIKKQKPASLTITNIHGDVDIFMGDHVNPNLLRGRAIKDATFRNFLPDPELLRIVRERAAYCGGTVSIIFNH